LAQRTTFFGGQVSWDGTEDLDPKITALQRMN
jgi:hypothetical protein